jgi:catechol 2,3-dioxygenase-like lactoylglutathione lyase family enzyme
MEPLQRSMYRQCPRTSHDFAFYANVYGTKPRGISMEDLTYLGFGHVGMFIKDMAQSKQFYMDILGFKVVSEFVGEDGTKLCFINNGNCTIELLEFTDTSISSNRKDGIHDHLSIRVADVEAAKAYLESKGVVFETEILLDEKLYDRGEKFAMFRGPSGERLQIEQIL